MVRGTTKCSVHNSTRLSIQPRVLESGEQVRDIYIYIYIYIYVCVYIYTYIYKAESQAEGTTGRNPEKREIGRVVQAYLY